MHIVLLNLSVCVMYCIMDSNCDASCHMQVYKRFKIYWDELDWSGCESIMVRSIGSHLVLGHSGDKIKGSPCNTMYVYTYHMYYILCVSITMVLIVAVIPCHGTAMLTHQLAVSQ